MEIAILKDVIIIFGLSILVIYLFHLIKLPSIIGFLFTGMIAGPHGLKIINAVEEVEKLAEIGVILLLFTIGIEFSVKKLIKARKAVLLGGTLQVGLVILLTAVVTFFLGLNIREAVFIGFLAALSSTAVVMKIIQGKGELGTFHGQTSVALLIFQDIAIVPMILFIPLLAGTDESPGSSMMILIAKLVGVVLVTFVSARYLVPGLLYRIAKTRSGELFLITVIVIGFAAAWLTAYAGLSLALGGFLAGLIISESEYSQQAIGNISPFRDLFTSFFFVSVGMLLDIHFIFREPLLVISIAIGVLLLKTFVSGLVAFLLGYPFRTTVIVGLTISQIGEFSFVLAEIGNEHHLMSPEIFQLFLSSSVITISLTPFIIDLAPRIADRILKYPLPNKLRCGLSNLTESEEVSFKDHLIIIGYGLNGKNVAGAARHADIPHVIIELNPDTVKEELARGEIIQYGDATQEHILQHASIEKALILVCTIPGSTETRIITQLARKMNPHLHIIIRTRFVEEVDELYKLGADEVIPEEFETSLEIFTRVLIKFLIPHDEIERMVRKVRSDSYKMFRSLPEGPETIAGLRVSIPKVEIVSYHVGKNCDITGCSAAGHPFSSYDAELLAVSREGKIFSKPGDNFIFQKDDILFLLASGENLVKLDELFKEKDTD